MFDTPKATIIVATDMNDGIGYNGDLPWKNHDAVKHITKLDMDHFVATRKSNQSEVIKNVLVMGSTTWSSISLPYRPFDDNFTIIMSHNKTKEDIREQFFQDIDHYSERLRKKNKLVNESDIKKYESTIEELIIHVHESVHVANDIDDYKGLIDILGSSVGQIFCVGGAQIYNLFLDNNEIDKVIMTKFLSTYKSDTVFPHLDLAERDKSIDNNYFNYPGVLELYTYTKHPRF